MFLETGTGVGNVTTWIWNSSSNFTGGSWPGQAMTLMGTNNDGSRKIWKWAYNGTASSEPTGVIFVTDGQQTSDLTYRNHGYYIDGNWDHEVTNYTSPAPTLTIDKPSGHYEGSVAVTVTASESNAVIVYTTDGSTPTASSHQAIGQKTLTFTDNTVLTAGVLYEGKVRNIVQREYIFHGFVPYTATVYIKDPTAAPNNWNNVYVYAWDNTGAISDSWPGVKVTATVTGINRDIYLEVTSTTNKYTVADITSQYTFLKGDVNGDGEVSINDVTALISILLGYPADAASMYRAEVDGDGEISIGDVTALISILLGK